MEIIGEVEITVEALCTKCHGWFVLKPTKEGSSIWEAECLKCGGKVIVQVCPKR